MGLKSSTLFKERFLQIKRVGEVFEKCAYCYRCVGFLSILFTTSIVGGCMI